MQKTLHKIFENGITDPRRKGSVRHKLIDVIIIGILCMITGGKGFTDMNNFGIKKHEWLKTFLELPNGIPSHDVFNDIFAALNPKEFHKCFKEWVECSLEVFEEQVIGIDGKTARRTKDVQNGKKALHVVSAWASEKGIVLGQIATEEKSNEIKAIPELLKTLLIKGCIITIDAMGTQKKIAETIIKNDADYILSLKENQKTLHDDVALFMKEEIICQDKKELKATNQYHKTVEKGHGRMEIRECFTSEEIDWLPQKGEWMDLNGVAAIISTREINSVISKETNYYIYSLKDATAEKILNSKRQHWGIENSLHWVMDMAFREDESRIRMGNAAENLNIISHMALNLLKSEKSLKRGIAGKMYNCALSTDYLIEVLNTALHL